MTEEIARILDGLKNDINQLLGFHDDTPRINYGPCGVFAHLFFEAWNQRFADKIHICFIMTLSREECYHIAVRLPSGALYDGGIGIHSEELYSPEFLIDEMLIYDQDILEQWSYGLDRTYPRFCPDFNKNTVTKLIHASLYRIPKHTIFGENK